MNQRKSEIFKAAIEAHQSVIDDFTRRIRDLMATDGNVNEEEYDSHEQSIKADRAREVDMLNKELEFAKNELGTLSRLQDTVGNSNSVAPGSVVQTDRGTYFISASIEEFKVGNNEYFGVSRDSPIYKAMQGKTVGDSFSVGNKVYRITDVY